MDAAKSCFSRQGFHQTSIQDICQDAALSPGAVYKYFSSKEHIIAASCLECQQHIVDLVNAAKSRGSSPLESLDFIFDHGLEMLGGEAFREPAMMNVQLWSEAMRSEEIKQALLAVTFNTLGQAFAQFFKQAQEEGDVDPQLDPQALGITVMGLFHGLVLHKSLDPEIDIAACGQALRALYQGLFRTSAGEA